MKKLLVTGAAGFIGSHIVELARAQGWEVRATDVPGADMTPAKAAGAEVVQVDLLEAQSLQPLVKGVNVVLHGAAIFDFGVPAETLQKINADTVHNVCAASEWAGVERFVLLSSVGVYGPPAKLPCPEDTEKRPRNPYEKTKWIGEQAAFEHAAKSGLPVTALRPTIVYGPRGRYAHAIMISILSLLKAGGRRRLPLVDGGPVTHHVHVEDVAAAALFLCGAEGVEGRSFNVADDTPLSLGDFSEAMFRPLGIEKAFRVPYLKFSMKLFPMALGLANKQLAKGWARLVAKGRVKPELRPRIDPDWFEYFGRDHYYDVSAIKAAGFKLRRPDFREGIAETVRWYIANGWIPS